MLGLQQQPTVAGALHRLTSSRARSRAKAVLRLILALGHKFHFALYSAVESLRLSPICCTAEDIIRLRTLQAARHHQRWAELQQKIELAARPIGRN